VLQAEVRRAISASRSLLGRQDFYVQTVCWQQSQKCFSEAVSQVLRVVGRTGDPLLSLLVFRAIAHAPVQSV